MLGFAGLSVFAQKTELAPELAPGARTNFRALLNVPAMAQPVVVTPSNVGKNWYSIETDAHVFTGEVSVKQVAAVLLDLEGYAKYFDGNKSKITVSVVSPGPNETIADFVLVSIIPVIRINIRTPYRTSVVTRENTDKKFIQEIRQLPSDSNSNKDIKNLIAYRYAEEVIIDGKPYTYIRMASINDADASILPGAQGILEKNSSPVNEEALQMIIKAAKNK